jgi:hypothetical protein
LCPKKNQKTPYDFERLDQFLGRAQHIEDKFGGPDEAWVKVPGPTLPPGTYEVEWTFKVIIKPTDVKAYQSLQKAKSLFGLEIKEYLNGIEGYTYKYGYDFLDSPFKFKFIFGRTIKVDFEVCSAYRAFPYWAMPLDHELVKC